MATSKEECSTKKPLPQLIVLDRSFKLAEQWVNNMSKPKSSGSEKPDVPLEARPPRLGIGATLSKDSKFTPSDNPLERKLFSLLNAGKKKARLIDEDLAPSAKKDDEESSDEEETDSRTRAVSKSRPRNFTTLLHGTKKKKKHG